MRSGASLPSDVSGMSILPNPQSAQSRLYSCSNVWPTAARIANAETLTYSELALPALSATTLPASILPIGAFCSGVPVLNRTSLPCCASEQHVTTSTPLALAAEIGPASASLSAASMITAFAPLRMAAWNAFCTFSGEPSVPTCLTDQPSILAPSARIGPCTAHASTPQLMKVIFLPVGIGLSIGLACVICVGRVADVSVSCLAAVTSALPPFAEPPLLLALSPLPQPVATNSSAARPASASRVWTDLSRPVMLDMNSSSKWIEWVGGGGLAA